MVSRSLEKMMLIAVGLSSALIIGVPVLLYAINTMTTTQQIQYAQQASEAIFNATQQIDDGELTDITIQAYIPSKFAMMTDESGFTLQISIDTGRPQPETCMTWSEVFNHQIVVNYPLEPGNYYFTFAMVSNVIHITYSTSSS
ncbi:hypothetical protein EU527_19255 [Candidatus Thorarchaeota archaeon]|nr:MAG: hypothetical protein EU527_19255 [Candidatus Thorarchaeota archaeon]